MKNTESSAHAQDGRALRRHQTQRIKKARQGYWGRNKGSGSQEPMSPRHLGIVCATAAVCSCWMCGNDRKFNGDLNIQERRMYQDSD